MQILIRYGEIGIKSDEVRAKFEDKLVENIELSLEDKEVYKQNMRYFIGAEEEEVPELVYQLKKIPGIKSVSPCLKAKVDSNFSDIYSVVNDLIEGYEDQGKDFSFAISCRRVGGHSFTSKEVKEEVGQRVVDDYNWNVDLDQPDLEIFIEIRNKSAYLYTDKFEAVGGLPTGVEGEVIALIEDRASIVAAFSLIKRGCKVIPLVIDHDLDKYEEGLDVLRQYQTEVKLMEIKEDLEREEMLEKSKEVAEIFDINAVVLGDTIEDLEENEVTDRDDIVFLQPNCSLSDEEVLDRYSEIEVTE